MENLECYHCQQVIIEGLEFSLGDEVFCSPRCRDSYFVCRDCSNLFHRNSANRVYDDEVVCDDCFNSYSECYGCGEYFADDDMVRLGRASFCDRCIEHYHVCNNCGLLLHEESVYFNDDGPFCEDCYRSARESEYVHEAHYKPSPEFFGGGKVHYGMELEVDRVSNGDYKDLCTSLYDLSNHEYTHYLKKDGSLSNGIEIVFNPRTMENWKTDGLELLEYITMEVFNYGGKSYDTNTCGVHIHRSREDLDDFAVSKLLIFFARFRREIIAVARRETSYASFQEVYEDSREKTLIFKKVRDGRILDYGRYQAVNLQNRKTIEFRVFRGTLKVEALLGYIQFCDAVCSFVKGRSLKYMIDKCSWTEFLHYAKDQKYFIKLWDRVKSRLN